MEGNLYCIKCGCELPDDAQFCVKCGAPVGGAQAATSVEYEYKECGFEIEESHAKDMEKEWWVLIGPDGHTVESAKALAWQALRDFFMEKLQEDLENGWEPIEPLGPNCVQLRFFEAPTKRSGLSNLARAVSTGGVSLLIDRLVKSQYATIQSVKVQARRRKR